MYRYIVDNAITYTPDDLVLFRESPFAAWMERLTLENPDHGIPPDLDSIGAYPEAPQQHDIVATLRSEGRKVALIESDQEEPDRRIATLEAMRLGADFIVNGQLAFGPLSGAVDLLMRTSGYSELGDFLYIPCETRIGNSLQSPFRLCFAADLLATLQGRLPAQVLIIRNGAEVVPLQTEDHIYYYRAVQQRFFAAMQNFRKHRMPDPAESAHFGRWAECASEVLKQRASAEPQREEQPAQQETEDAVEVPQLRVASGAAGRSQYGGANYRGNANTADDSARESSGAGVTLAEQARLLKPGSFGNGKPPGHTPSLARVINKPLNVAAQQKPETPAPADASDETLENLEFIGSSQDRARSATESEIDFGEATAPAPNLRGRSPRDSDDAFAPLRSAPVPLQEREPGPPVFLPPDREQGSSSRDRNEFTATPAPSERLNLQHRGDVEAQDEDSDSVIDMDSAPAPNLAPVVQRAEAVFKRLIRDDPMFKKAEPQSPPRASTFSNSLHTSEEFDES